MLELCGVMYALCGFLVAMGNDQMVLRENLDDVAERVVYFARAWLAWPTYLAEDFMAWRRRDADC